ncbi:MULTISPECIES: hypothetical protein [Clostridium]|uniref:Uncharacterized protein n=3 Tax=Clostridium TaxID=1485 RepID=A0AA86JI50_9CLOT|nr:MULTISPECIES: hypothetical protein [Clostridium]MBS4781090.1 hypothetical protein [Clostridium sp.]MDU4479038.1 hypothetical protein [Clostridium sp.]MDU4848076.1 hypothetical protein [Clostridium sp.]CAG9706974.1 Conserved hypothetical protein [Clostridium neonatale]CAG9708055.1 Conserved hypothetical protein [Clostridium neonatale]
MMTILEILTGKRVNNKVLNPALEVIKDSYGDIRHDNYEIVVDNEGDLQVKIPSLVKKDEYEYKKITEYEYQKVMCMKISELYNGKNQEYIAKKFYDIYGDKLELLYKDVNSIEELKQKVKSTKKNIDYLTYISIGAIVLQGIMLIIFNNISSLAKIIIGIGIILLFSFSIFQQFTEDKRVKTLIDGYVNVLKTDWYKSEMLKQYVFLCNIME